MLKLSMFLVFEGIDGSGKDTQLHETIRWINGPDFPGKTMGVCLESEPTFESEAGRRLREWLKQKDGGIDTFDQEKILSLYLEDRLAHSAKIRRLQEEGKIVLSSRYDLSSYAYQALNCEPSELEGYFDKIYRLHRYQEAGGCLIPDLTLFFTLPIDESMHRIDKKGSQEGYEKVHVLHRVSENYQKAISFLQAKDGRRMAVCEAMGTVEEVFSRVQEVLSEVIVGEPL